MLPLRYPLMSVIAVPNVSEGRSSRLLSALASALQGAGGRVLDVHSDAVHNRTVLTVAAGTGGLTAPLVALASAAQAIDLTEHSGVHPRIGALDVCPIVPVAHDMSEAVEVARSTAREIAETCRLPVFLYGLAATRSHALELPDLRRGGLETLSERAKTDLPPDFGPTTIDPRKGVVCVGARGPLIAFNVWISGAIEATRSVAAALRTSAGGPPGVRALAFEIEPGVCQVSMNLIDPETTGIDAAFETTQQLVEGAGLTITGTEIVGVPHERFLPDPKKKAARLLITPGRSLESLLAG